MPPVSLLVDTDIGPDCDDAAALALLHSLADRGEVKILGITHCTSSPYGAGCIDAINAYYGRPELPIGTLKQPGFLHGPAYERYNRHIHDRYPHRYPDSKDVPEAVALLRRLLAKQEDGQTVMAAIGPLINMAALLASEPDCHSPLSGADLIRRKVARLVVMGGAFPSGLEWNFEQHPSSAQVVCAKWPTPVLFSGYEIGCAIHTGQTLYDRTPSDHPVRQAYERFTGGTTRESWDLTVILASIRNPRDYWDIEEGGFVEVLEDGTSIWHSGETEVGKGKEGGYAELAGDAPTETAGNQPHCDSITTAGRCHAYLKPKMAPVELADKLNQLLVP